MHSISFFHINEEMKTNLMSEIHRPVSTYYFKCEYFLRTTRTNIPSIL